MTDDFPTLDHLRLPEQQLETQFKTIPRETRSSYKHPKIKGEFLKGPIPLDWLGCAAKLPGKAPLSTALAIMFEVGRRRSNEIKLTTAILQRFGVTRKAKYRGIKLLETAGLISVIKLLRKNPLVAVLSLPVETAKPIVSADVATTDQIHSII